MAFAGTCPSCKKPVSLAAVPEGGRVVCPNPQCGHQFLAQSAPGGKARAGSNGRTGPKSRAGTARSAALSKLPANMYASPAFVAAGAGVVLLYGLVLFAVVSDMRKKELARLADEEQRTVASTEPFIPLPDISSKPEERESPKEPAPTTKPKEEAPAAKTAPSPAPAASTPTPNPALEPTTTPTPPAESSKSPPQTPKAKEAPTAVALATNAAKPQTPETSIGGIGSWFDPDKDSQYRSDGSGVTITIPGTPHVNSLQIRKANAPRILREVKGDFLAQVRIPDRIQPGSQPLEGFPIAFQGAGLLLWQDEKNYVRLERAAASAPDRPLSHQILLESLRDGKPGKPEYLTIREKPILLRMERKGSDINCSYSADGKTWIPVKNAALGFNNAVGVGVSAGNLAPKSFSARFENFTLDSGGGKTGKSRTQ